MDYIMIHYVVLVNKKKSFCLHLACGIGCRIITSMWSDPVLRCCRQGVP